MKIIQIKYDNEKENNDLLMLLNNYAMDEMGGGKPLDEYTRENLLATLSQRQDVVSFIAYIEQEAVGLINAFEGFSTFKCKPLLNIHDVCVRLEYRRQGVASQLLQAIEQLAVERGYCKLTLEVLQANVAAQKAYRQLGFAAYELDPKMGTAMFWEKEL